MLNKFWVMVSLDEIKVIEVPVTGYVIPSPDIYTSYFKRPTRQLAEQFATGSAIKLQKFKRFKKRHDDAMIAALSNKE
jgi:hypothetical protein